MQGTGQIGKDRPYLVTQSLNDLLISCNDAWPSTLCSRDTATIKGFHSRDTATIKGFHSRDRLDLGENRGFSSTKCCYCD
jgi:hypothetical protein